MFVMRPNLDKTTIIILGFWNRMIFTPAWVSKEIFNTERMNLQVPFAPMAPYIYETDEQKLLVSGEKIKLSSKTINEESTKNNEQIAVKILESLTKTPVSAVGINFGFIETAPNDEILKLFNFNDDSEYGADGWDIKTRTINRRLEKDEKTLNLEIILNDENGEVEINANYHYDVKSALEIVEIINEKTDLMSKEIEDIIKDKYNLTIEEGEI